MDYMLELPEPSKKDEWVEKKVDEWVESVELFIDSEATNTTYPIDLYDYFDWAGLELDLVKRAEEAYDDMIGEAQIEAWEVRQESRWGGLGYEVI